MTFEQRCKRRLRNEPCKRQEKSIAVSAKVLRKVILSMLEEAAVLGAERTLERAVGGEVRESQEIK